MKIKVIQCKSCQSVITSRSQHDMNYCQCGLLAVDGGHYSQDRETYVFTRIIGRFQTKDISTIELPVTPKDLHRDWNKQINEFKDLRKYA